MGHHTLTAGGVRGEDAGPERSRLSARARIEQLLDAGSFTELNALAEHQCHAFGMEQRRIPGDGVITGHGRIDGRRVLVYAGDESFLGGSTGRMHGMKIQYVQRLARENRCPVIGLNASAGARIQEGVDNVYGITGMFLENVRNSGVVPQIAAVMGTCSGGGAYTSALCDFLVQVQGAPLFVTGAALTREITGADVSADALGGADMHGEVSGVAHLVARDDRDCLQLVRRLLGFLPQSSSELPPVSACRDAVDRRAGTLAPLPPGGGDLLNLIRHIADDGDFLEIHPGFARNITVGFARMGGVAIGIVASNPRHLQGYLDGDACTKAARFVRTCDAFNLPLLSLVDCPGFLPGPEQERRGLIRHGAKLMYAWAEAQVPKIAVIAGRMQAGAIPAMGVHEIGFDQVFAWPSARMQIIDPVPAVRILWRREIESAADSDAVFREKLREYRETFNPPWDAAARAVVDAVIEPAATRPTVIAALDLLQGKRAAAGCGRRHGNIPL